MGPTNRPHKFVDEVLKEGMRGPSAQKSHTPSSPKKLQNNHPRSELYMSPLRCRSHRPPIDFAGIEMKVTFRKN